jgi:hypothetical protein
MPNERDEDLARAHYAKKYKDLKELDAYANKTIEDVSKTRDDLQNGNHPDLAINVPHTVAQGFSKLGFNTFATVADFFSNFGGPSHTTRGITHIRVKIYGFKFALRHLGTYLYRKTILLMFETQNLGLCST